jgi:hypothetical protein
MRIVLWIGGVSAMMGSGTGDISVSFRLRKGR